MADLLASIASESNAVSAPVVPALGLSTKEIQNLVQEAMAYAAAHGMLVAAKESTTHAFNHIPFCLFPVKIPKTEFEKGLQLSPLFTTLVDRISRDPDWIHQQLESVIQDDEFTRKLVELSKFVQQEGVVQKAYLGIHRSDYMLHDDPSNQEKPKILQVWFHYAIMKKYDTRYLTSDFIYFSYRLN